MEKVKLSEVFDKLFQDPTFVWLCPNGCYFINNWCEIKNGKVVELDSEQLKETSGQQITFKCPTGHLSFSGSKDPFFPSTVKYRDLANIKQSFEFLQNCVTDCVTIPF